MKNVREESRLSGRLGIGVRAMFVRALFLGLALVLNAEGMVCWGQTDETLFFRVDRSDVPELTFDELTFVLPVGNISGSAVMSNGITIPATYDSNAGELVFTTNATRFQVDLTGVDVNQIGDIRKASLKHNKKWAWSLGLDDNVNLKPTIQMLDSFDYPGTLFLIANLIDDTRQEDWIVDKPDLLNYLNNGWSLGNHTWDHLCDGSVDLQPTIDAGYTRIKEVIADSSVPDYQLTSFAAPCFIAEYHDYILSQRDNSSSEVQFNESGGDFRISVDHIGQPDFWLVDRFVQSFNFDRRIGRDATIGWDAASVIAEIDWISQHANHELHLWYNTLAHGNSESTIQSVAQHIFDNYGAGGTDEVWVAPSDQIYSYLLVRESTSVTTETTTSVVPVNINVLQGQLVSGTTDSLATSDDNDVSIRRNLSQTNGVIAIDLEGVSPEAEPSSLAFQLECSGFFRTQLTQSVQLFDFAAGTFETIDSREMARFNDQVATGFASGDLSRFVEPDTNRMRCRLEFQSENPRQRFTANLDHAIWTVR